VKIVMDPALLGFGELATKRSGRGMSETNLPSFTLHSIKEYTNGDLMQAGDSCIYRTGESQNKVRPMALALAQLEPLSMRLFKNFLGRHHEIAKRYHSWKEETPYILRTLT
jgi:hypothetical protein